MTAAPFLTEISFKPTMVKGAGYPFDLPLFEGGDFAVRFESPLTILMGENGCGKSTLLEAIADNAGFGHTGGSRNHAHVGGRSGSTGSLSDSLRFAWRKRMPRGFFFRAESFFRFSDYLDNEAGSQGPGVYAPYGGRPFHQMSHGEAFLEFFATRPSSEAIYILDEPEVALSPKRQLSLMEVLHELAVAGDAQIIIATHSPLLASVPSADVLQFRDGAFEPVRYDQTDHFRLYKRFVEAPETLFRHMFPTSNHPGDT